MRKNLLLSPSAINLYLNDKALFVMKYFFKIRDKNNIFTIRGKLSELYVNLCLKNKKVITDNNFYEECLKDRIFDFDDVNISSSDLKDFKEWGYNGLINLPNKKEIISTQTKISTIIKGLPFIGYLDYEYKDEIIDLKTCNKLPLICSIGYRKGMISKQKHDNIRQQVIYKLATGKTVKLLYVTKREHLLYEITEKDVKEVLPSIYNSVNEIKELLKLSQEELLNKIKPGNMKTFFWSNYLQKEAKKLWNL